MYLIVADYYLAATQILNYWGTEVSINHIPREANVIDNEMAQMASRA